MNKKKTAIVVGAGVGGLNAAFRLQKAGFDVQVLEQLDGVGGRTRSVHLNGCIIDAGATVLPGSYRETFALIEELGIEGELETVGGAFAVPREGRFHIISIERPLRAMVSTPLLSLASKLSMVKLVAKLLPMVPRFSFTSLAPLANADRETLFEYCQRALPTEVYEYLLNPMLKFLYIHNGRRGSLVELLWWLITMGLKPSKSFKKGMQTLANSLAEQLNVQCDVRVTAIEQSGDSVKIEALCSAGPRYFEADYCVVSTPAPVTADIAGRALEAGQSTFMASREYAPCIVVCFCTRKRPALDVLMIEVPDSCSENLATIVFQHRVASGRAPADKGLVNGYFTGEWSRRLFDADNEVVIAEAIAEMRVLVPEVEDVDAVHIQRWPYNAALSEVGACRRIGDFQQSFSGKERIVYIGDYLVQASVNVAVATSNLAAKEVISAQGGATS